MINRLYIELGYKQSDMAIRLAVATLVAGGSVLIASIFSGKAYAIATAAVGGAGASLVVGQWITKKVLPFNNAYLGWGSSPTERALFLTLTLEEQRSYTPDALSFLQKFQEMSIEEQTKLLQDDKDHYKGKYFHEYKTATAVNAAAVCSVQQ